MGQRRRAPERRIQQRALDIAQIGVYLPPAGGASTAALAGRGDEETAEVGTDGARRTESASGAGLASDAENS